jgi:hypothetical protein
MLFKAALRAQIPLQYNILMHIFSLNLAGIHEPVLTGTKKSMEKVTKKWAIGVVVERPKAPLSRKVRRIPAALQLRRRKLLRRVCRDH